MSSSAWKKEKHRLKRKEKKQQLQRAHSRTALQRIAAEGGRLECWIMPKDWKNTGIATMRVLGGVRGGRAATAVFLVDFWAVGLKDAFGRGDVPELEFRKGNLDPWIEESGAVKLDEKIARRMIAGAVRFGRQNSFHMPPQWEKFIVIFGRDILSGIPTADLKDFGIDGGLRYVGTMDFLRSRLTVPPDDFLARKNVHWVMEVDSGFTNNSDAEEFVVDEPDPEDVTSLLTIQNVAKDGAQRIAERARQWCATHGEEPIPMLDKAAKIVIHSLLPAIDAKQAGEDPTNEDVVRSGQLIHMMLAQHPPAEREALDASVSWLRDILGKIYIAQPSPESAEVGRFPQPSDGATQQALQGA